MTKQLYTALSAIASISNSPGFCRAQALTDLPGLLVFTDPKRSPEPIELAKNLPPDCAMVYRHFGHKTRVSTAHKLVEICKKNGSGFLVGADWELAQKVGADGVHMPQRLIGHISEVVASSEFRWVTAAAHNIAAARAAHLAGADAVILSSVFSSGSKSADREIGAKAFAAMVDTIDGVVFALGGITPKNIHKLQGVCSGVALVSAGVSLKEGGA